MIALSVIGVVTLSAGVTFSLAQRASAAPYDVCASSCPYVSINDALAAALPGATIRVGPGVYGPNEVGATTNDTQIKINKSVTLIGAGVGLSIINDAPANQGTATAGVILITTPSTPGNISVSGFTIEGAIANDSNDDGILMSITDANASDVVTVKDNLFYGDTTLDPGLLLDQTDSIALQGSSATTVVKHNTFQGVFRAVLIEDNPGVFRFVDNDVDLHPIYDPSIAGMIDNWAEGLWFLADNGINMSAPSLVSGNTFENYKGLAVGLNGGYHATGYKGSISYITIHSNIFLNTSTFATYSNPQQSSAVLLHGWEPTNSDPNSTVSHVTVSSNTFTPASGDGNGSSIGLLGSVAANIVLKDNVLTGAGSQTPAGISMTTLYSVAQISIRGNIIHGYNDGASADVVPAGAKIVAKQNCISGNVAYGFSAAGGAVNAQSNWWGASAGPSPTGPGAATGYGDPVTTHVDASNWLTAPPMSACAGPVTTNAQSNVSPAPINANYTVTAKVDTSTTSNLDVASAWYQMDGGAIQPMSPTSGSFGTATSYTVTSGTLTAASTPGTHQFCIFGIDVANQVGASDCFTLQVVYPTVNTTTTVTSNNNPSVYGQSVTFTITVVSANGTPTGSVSLTDNGNPLAGPLTLNGSGVATYTTSALTVGSHPLVASYSGDASGNPIFQPSTSTTLSQVVNKVATSTNLTTSPNPSVSGQTVTISVSVVAADSSALSGSVVVKDGATTVGTITLTSGAGSLTTSALSVGAHNLAGSYSGDATHNTSSGATSQTVNATPAAPTGNSNAYIRIAQSSEAYPTSDVAIDGATTFPNVAACTVQPYYPITAGKHTFTVQAPSGGATVITESITLTAGQYYTLAVVGNSAKSITPAILIFTDDNSVTPNQAKSRVYHLSDTLGSVQATVGSTTLAANLTFGNATSYANQAPGTSTYSFQPSSGPALTDAINESANQVYSIFLMCNGQVTNASATGVPVKLPQTGYGPTPFWMNPVAARALLILGALVLFLGLGGFGSYLAFGRRRSLGL